jgi:hypothetical protein
MAATVTTNYILPHLRPKPEPPAPPTPAQPPTEEELFMQAEAYRNKAIAVARRRESDAQEDVDQIIRRNKLNQHVVKLRSQLSTLLTDLKAAKSEYDALELRDIQTHDCRDAEYDSLLSEYRSLSPEWQDALPRPTEPRSCIRYHDTSHAFRDSIGRLTSKISCESEDRQPAWLPAITALTACVVEAIDRRGGPTPDLPHAASNIERDRRRAVDSLVKLSREVASKWKPTVVLHGSETVAANTTLKFDWDDLLDCTTQQSTDRNTIIDRYAFAHPDEDHALSRLISLESRRSEASAYEVDVMEAPTPETAALAIVDEPQTVDPVDEILCMDALVRVAANDTNVRAERKKAEEVERKRELSIQAALVEKKRRGERAKEREQLMEKLAPALAVLPPRWFETSV